ncbi:MAG: hypothetical protein IJ893_02575 [Bacteroidales bacterium]|nr:hypothetical protein [Bacteroidales bacterium]
METDPRQQIQSPDGATGISTDSSLDHLPADVKAIRALRSERHIPVADIVEVVSAIYPRFDRYLLSKVEHGEEYGIRLRADAQHELLTHFKVTEDGSKARRKPSRSKPRRISCRLTDKAYGLLQRELDRTGVTMQSWLEALIAKALIGGNEHGID